MEKRGSGILLHITSLPSPYGIGDFGINARDFVDFLAKTGQSYWQILPLNLTSPAYGNSPYSSLPSPPGTSGPTSPPPLPPSPALPPADPLSPPPSY